MRRVFAVMVAGSISVALIGCDSGGGNVAQDADDSAVADYDAMLEADEALMSDEEAADDPE